MIFYRGLFIFLKIKHKEVGLELIYQHYFISKAVFVAGVDEVGRGALAGPILAGAVGLDRRRYRMIKRLRWSQKVDDSKKLTEAVRWELSKAIRESLPCAIGLVSVAEIDAWGLTRANQVAISRAVKLLPKASLILGDGNLLVPDSFASYQPVVRADQTIWLVAAASIIAKVERDCLMHQLHEQYPQYGFDRHVGYGTKLHREAILQFGPCPLHRRCFKLV